MTETLRNEIIHLTASFILMLAFIPQLGVTLSFLVIFSFGFFLDLDHLFDYSLYIRGSNKRFITSNFLSGKHFSVSKKTYVLLHSWELVALLFVPYLYFGKMTYLAAALSLATHLIIDQFTNQVLPLFYFLSYRYLKRFSNLCS